MAIYFMASTNKCVNVGAGSLGKGEGGRPLVHEKPQDVISGSGSSLIVTGDTRVLTCKVLKQAIMIVAVFVVLLTFVFMISLNKGSARFDLAPRTSPAQESSHADNYQASMININSYEDLLGIKCKTIDRPYYTLPEFDPTLDPWMYSKCICDDAQGVVTEIDLSIPEHLWDNIGDAIDNPPLEMAADQQFYCISRNVTGFEGRLLRPTATTCVNIVQFRDFANNNVSLLDITSSQCACIMGVVEERRGMPVLVYDNVDTYSELMAAIKQSQKARVVCVADYAKEVLNKPLDQQTYIHLGPGVELSQNENECRALGCCLKNTSGLVRMENVTCIGGGVAVKTSNESEITMEQKWVHNEVASYSVEGRRLSTCSAGSHTGFYYQASLKIWSSCTHVHWRNTGAVWLPSGSGSTQCEACGTSGYGWNRMRWKRTTPGTMFSQATQCPGTAQPFYHYYNVQGPVVIPVNVVQANGNILKACQHRITGGGYDVEIYGSSSAFPCDIYLRQSIGVGLSGSGTRSIC